jgi:hypothetical protein
MNVEEKKLYGVVAYEIHQVPVIVEACSVGEAKQKAKTLLSKAIVNNLDYSTGILYTCNPANLPQSYLGTQTVLEVTEENTPEVFESYKAWKNSFIKAKIIE